MTEVAIITTRTEQYYREIKVEEDDIDSITRIKHLIEIEIKHMRCNRLMAMNPEPVQTIWEDERPRRVLNPVARYDLSLMREHRKVLGSLM